MNVVILADTVAAQLKWYTCLVHGYCNHYRYAYISFTSKNAAEKALSLSGAQFFSRFLKVVRKAKVGAVISKPAQLVAKSVRAHLQWRRDTVSVPPQPSSS